MISPRSLISVPVLLLLAASSLPAASTIDPLKQREGKYELTLRLPADGLRAAEEMEIEFHIADTSRIDPVMGATPVIRSDVSATVGMPAMPGMPKFHEKAHAEGVPGDYGIHPTFAHGGEYLLHVSVKPPDGEPFSVDFPLAVADATTAKSRKKAPPPYRLELNATPKNPRAGEAVQLLLTIRSRNDPRQPVAAFDQAHERYLHLLIVREDLGTFAHEHPDLSPDGTFRLRYTFPTGGEYHLFADVAPKGAGSQILMARLKVSGNAGEHYDISKALASASDTVVSGGLVVHLDTKSPVPSSKTLPLVFDLRDKATGNPPSGMEPYLGAGGHLLMVGDDGTTFVHAHPEESPAAQTQPGTIAFLARFPRPGIYRAWAQFQRNGEVHTVSFILEAR